MLKLLNFHYDAEMQLCQNYFASVKKLLKALSHRYINTIEINICLNSNKKEHLTNIGFSTDYE